MKKFWITIIVIGILAFIALQIWKTINHLAAPSLGVSVISTPTTEVVYGPVILKAIRNQAKLETVTMSFANDVDITKTWGIEGACREKLTYLGYFTVTAGVDLQQLNESSIIVNNSAPPPQTELTLTLPPAEILHLELDTQRSRVIHNETSIISQLCGTRLGEMTLEAQSKIRAMVEESAKQNEILQQAQERAAFELQRLLMSMGYAKVNVIFNTSYNEQ